MKATQLRQSILQAAVQGKLVPQNVHDEPASELLERIRQEKARLVKEGKIKKEKPLALIAEDEIPYDLPEGWSWCRLNEVIIKIGAGSTPTGGRNVYVKHGYKFIRSQNVYNSGLILDRVAYVDEAIHKKMEGATVQANDLLLNITGASIGRCCIVPSNFDTGHVNQHVMIIRLVDLTTIDYLHVFLTSPYLQDVIMDQQVGVSREGLSATKLKNFVVPLPPLAEQQRIVAKVDELMALCDELEAAEKELDALESRFAEYLPKSILQAAVQGKLVPQNVHDEPATELLKRIQREKVRLVKEGKIKKEKPLPPIVEDEIPYDLPNGWVWCRLGELITLISGRDLDTKDFNDEQRGIPYITGASAIENNTILINRWTDVPIVISRQNDLLLSCKGTVGKLVFNDIGDCHIARQIMAIRMFSNQVNKEYIRLFLSSHVDKLIVQAKSMIPGISRDDVLNATLPLPPLAEQQRIVARVDELMALCDELKAAKDISVKWTASNIVPFPQQGEDKLEIGIAARGEMQGLSDEVARDIKEMFGDDCNS